MVKILSWAGILIIFIKEVAWAKLGPIIIVEDTSISCAGWRKGLLSLCASQHSMHLMCHQGHQEPLSNAGIVGNCSCSAGASGPLGSRTDAWVSPVLASLYFPNINSEHQQLEATSAGHWWCVTCALLLCVVVVLR